MKKILCLVLAIIMVSGIFYSTNILAGAAGYNPYVTFTNNDVQTVFRVRNNSHDGTSTTNLGGISVGAANNRLFCVKSSSDEQVGTLYYYNNIYDERFNTGEKEPKKIVFTNGLLGHANAMAVDNKYIYVTMWSGTERNKVLRISRRAISYLSSGSVISSDTAQVTKDGDTVRVCTILTPKTSSGGTYNNPIASITKYSYNSTTGITKFIIGYPSNVSSTLCFAIATLNEATGNFTVSTGYNDKFYVKSGSYTGFSGVIKQDIFYDASYGLFIALWAGGTNNYVLRYDIRDIRTSGKTSYSTFDPLQTMYISKTSENGTTISRFEIESIAFIKRDASLNSTDYKFVFSVNKLPVNSNMGDSIEELKGFTTKVPKFS